MCNTMLAAKAMVILLICAGWTQSFLLDNTISTEIMCTGSFKENRLPHLTYTYSDDIFIQAFSLECITQK